MADTSPKYDAVPLYDVEEQGFYDHYYQYDKHDNIKDKDLAFEEEFAAITDGLPGPSEWRRTLCTIGISMTILAFVMTLVLYPLGPDRDPPYILDVNRAAATTEHLHTLAVAGGGSLSIYSLHWEAKPGHEETTYVCQFESVCVQRRSGLGHGNAHNEYWLMGHDDEVTESIEDLDPLAADAFKQCLGNPQAPSASRHLGIKSVANFDGEINWRYGATIGFIKQIGTVAGFGDIVDWLQAWSRFLSVSINSPQFLNEMGVSSKHFFQHIIYLDQNTAYSAWRKLFSRVSYAAASAGQRSTFIGRLLDKSANLVIHSQEWVDRHTPTHSFWDQTHLLSGEATCFERMVLVAPSTQYFRDITDANYFRKWVLNEAGTNLERRLPRERKDVKAVLLLRPDRPMWDHKRLINTLHAAGVRDIWTTAVNQHTSYEKHVELWSRADLVISDDHAALTGQTLMQPGTGVIEIFPPLTYSEDHSVLASKTGVNYIGLKTYGLVPEDIVEQNEPEAMATLQRARGFFDRKLRIDQCQASEECSLAMFTLSAYVETEPFAAALEEMLQRIVRPPAHGCMSD